MSNKKPVVSISVVFCHNGRKYDGVSMRDGVTMELVDAPCGAGRQILQFGNTKNPPAGIIWDGVTNVDDKSTETPVGYLVLKPVVPTA